MTSKANIKIPNATDTEVFRLNIFSGEVGKLYGVNIGILNHTNRLIGVQLGVFNKTEKPTGIQVGILNNTDSLMGVLKIGLFNIVFPFDEGLNQRFRESIDKQNTDSQGKGISIGVINMSDSINLGIFNVQEGKSAFSFGVFNIGLSGYQIGILNYCPNSKIPFLVLVNYCNSQKDIP